MKLAYKEMGEGTPLIILHGLFGSSDNWQTLAKRFAENYKVYLVDQRNHGRSPHSDLFNYDVLAQDLREFFIDHGISKAIVMGHSMGGKTAMRFTQLFHERVSKLIVVDMGVKEYAPHHEKILAAFHTLDLPNLKSRSEADQAISELIPEFGVRQFILKNLYRKDKETFAWRPNYLILEKEMPNILSALPKQDVEIPACFVYGAQSNYIIKDEIPTIKKVFSNSVFIELPAGHWIHAEVPNQFYAAVNNFVTLST